MRASLATIDLDVDGGWDRNSDFSEKREGGEQNNVTFCSQSSRTSHFKNAVDKPSRKQCFSEKDE